MTVTEIHTLFLKLIETHLDSYSNSILIADNIAILNRSMNRIARHIYYYDPKIVWTLTNGTAEYSMTNTSIFSKMVRKPHQVFLNSQELRLYTMDQFTKRYTDFRWNATAGSPYCAYWRAGIMGLHVPPDAAAAATTCYVSAECYPTAMTTSNPDTTTPDMPFETHEAIAYLAAILAADPTASDDAAFVKMTSYNGQLAKDINDVRDLNEKNILGDLDAGHEKYIH